MNAYLLLPLIQALFCLVLMVVVLKGHLRSFTHRLFSAYLLGLAIWGIIIFGMRASPDAEHAYSWEKWLVAAAPFTSVLFYHFTIRYTATRVKSGLIPSLYVICFLFIPLGATDLVFSGMQIKPFGYAPIFGPVMPFHVLFNYGVFIMAFLIFVKAYRTSSYAEQRNRAAYIIIGMVFSLVGAAFDILTALGVPLYPGMIIGSIIFCLLTTIAIVRYNLLDIQVILRKSAAYILTSALIALPFISVFLLVTHFFKEASSSPWVYFLLLIALAFILPQLWQWIQRRVETWFYRDRYDYLKALGVFSQETQSVKDSAKLGSTMVNLLTGAPSSDFTIAFSSDLYRSSSHIILKGGSSLVKWLERSKEMLFYEDIDIIPQLQGVTSKERETLKKLRTKFIIGLKTPTGRLSGLLILGPKLSEQPYTIEDMQLIYAISRQAAINLENARLYSESQQEVRKRKRVEQALRESEEKYRALVENSPNLVAVYQDGHFTYVNRAACNRLVWTYEELTHPSFDAVEKLASEDSRHIVRENIAKRLRGEYVPPYEINMKTRDGSEFPALVYGGAISYDGKPASQVTFVDISERKRVEDEEERLQQELYLSSRLASIGELAAGVAHEINNPLTAILAFSERLLRRSTDEKTTEDLKIVHNEARRTAKVVENLLTFARRREPKKQYADINDIVQKALELRAYEFKTANIEVITELAPNLPQVVVDFHQIQEVFLNIILNAEQAMTSTKGEGKLSIKTQQVKGYIRISFTDSGPGIPAEHLEKVFNPFFTTRGEIGGTGLGLSICHGIVTEHGGKIYVKSKLGKGATFFVDLPLAREEKDRSKVVHKERAYP
jgi:two-component system NtrC family sensor kinase